MTTSQLPWHLKQILGSKMVTVHDGSGECIGHFKDWQDGEIVVRLVNSLGGSYSAMEDRNEETKQDFHNHG